MTVIVVTGIQAAGKSTVAQALAERLERSVHLGGAGPGATRPSRAMVTRHVW